jgi:hypothetical protein
VTRTTVVVWESGNVEWGLGMGKVEWNGATVQGWALMLEKLMGKKEKREEERKRVLRPINEYVWVRDHTPREWVWSTFHLIRFSGTVEVAGSRESEASEPLRVSIL